MPVAAAMPVVPAAAEVAVSSNEMGDAGVVESGATPGDGGGSPSDIEVTHLYKVFGPNPQAVMAQVEAGVSKDEILERTGHTVGLDDVNLSIKGAETFVVMGLSGSGKSTFVRCVNRLIDPTAGQIMLDGVDILQLDPGGITAMRRTKMSMVFQNFGLLPHRSVIRNVAYGLRARGVPNEERLERAARWIEIVGLQGYERQRPRQLSGGMQQRVGLARAFCTDPEILLMDEPFSALDPLIRREMQDELVRLQRDLRKTIVFITHDLDEALRLGDHIAILKDGKLVQVGTPTDIITNPADDYVRDFVSDVNRARVLTAGAAMDATAPLQLDAAPQSAVTAMRQAGRRIGFVTGADGSYRGHCGIEDASAAAERGDKDLSGIVRTSAPTALAHRTLHEILPLSAESDVPVAVLDDGDRFLGFLTRQGVLAAIAGDRTSSAGA